MDEKVRSRVERFGIGCVFKLMRILSLVFIFQMESKIVCNVMVVGLSSGRIKSDGNRQEEGRNDSQDTKLKFNGSSWAYRQEQTLRTIKELIVRALLLGSWDILKINNRFGQYKQINNIQECSAIRQMSLQNAYTYCVALVAMWIRRLLRTESCVPSLVAAVGPSAICQDDDRELERCRKINRNAKEKTDFRVSIFLSLFFAGLVIKGPKTSRRRRRKIVIIEFLSSLLTPEHLAFSILFFLFHPYASLPILPFYKCFLIKRPFMMTVYISALVVVALFARRPRSRQAKIGGKGLEFSSAASRCRL